MLSYSHGDRNVSNDMSKMRSLAKARFDNLAESSDELAFRKGDVLTVLDQKIDGLDGWWLCSFRGKQGIVPANRVTLLAGMYYESSVRFNTSPDSSISDGGGVDYDIPRSDPRNRQLPPLPPHNNAVQKESRLDGPVRELLYDIPKSLEKTRINADQPAMHSSYSAPNIARKIDANLDNSTNENLYDTPNSTAQLLVSSALTGRRSSGPISPLFRSGDSAVDMTSNRSSLMSNTSSPPGSSVCDSSSECATDIYDTPNSLKSVTPVNRRQLLAKMHQKQSDGTINKQSQSEELYDVPKVLQDTLLDYRDSGIYDNARLSTVQSSPSKDANLYDSPNSGSRPVPTGPSISEQHTSAPVYDVLPAHSTRQLLQKTDSGNSLTGQKGSLDIDDIEKLSLELDAAIEIIVKLQQHVNTSSTRLLSFVHSKWRVRSNLESVLYDLKLACVGLQSTLQEFYDFGIGALGNAASVSDKVVMNRLSLTLVPLRNKLRVVNESMKSLSGIKWHIAKLEEGATLDAGGDHLLRLMAVAREVGEDVSRVASVIHGNSSLLFASPADKVQRISADVTDSGSSSRSSQRKCLVHEDSIESYHEYDYCELTNRQDTPTNDLLVGTPNHKVTLDREQDSQYLRYYMQHVHAICDTVKLHVTRMQDILANNNQSNERIISHSRLLLKTAHKLVYIGDTLCRSVRQTSVLAAISGTANALCNALKDFIMSIRDVGLSQPASRPTALAKLGPSVQSIELRTESFRYVISSQAN